MEIRPIRPTDKSRLQEGLERLSPQSRRLRFMSAKNRLSSSELRYLTEIDGESHLALVAVEDGEIVGVARCVREILRPHRAEVAYVIADEHQGRGLGRRLLTELAELAAARGVRIFTATMSSDNTAAKRLLLTLGEPLLETMDGGVRELAVAVPRSRKRRRYRDRVESLRSAAGRRQGARTPSRGRTRAAADHEPQAMDDSRIK